MTIDTRRGIAYIPLGSPSYDFYGREAGPFPTPRDSNAAPMGWVADALPKQ